MLDQEAVKILNLLEKIQEHGIEVSMKMKWTKKLKSTDGLYEIRSSWHNNIQRIIYFKIETKHVYLITHGFTKKSQKTPLVEIKKAKKRRSEYLKNHDI